MYDKKWLEKILSGEEKLDASLLPDKEQIEKMDSYIGGYASSEVVNEIEGDLPAHLVYLKAKNGKRIVRDSISGRRFARRRCSKFLSPQQQKLALSKSKGAEKEPDINAEPFHDMPDNLGEIRNRYENKQYQLVLTFDGQSLTERFGTQKKYQIVIKSGEEEHTKETFRNGVSFNNLEPGEYQIFLVHNEEKCKLFSLELPEGEE